MKLYDKYFWLVASLASCFVGAAFSKVWSIVSLGIACVLLTLCYVEES